ncbi:MAG: hypothetical protein Q9215_000775 [Flavoplaca cf. flavocitrina]
MPSEETNKSIASHSPCSSCCSAVSETSTLVYDHETWVDFVPHVHELCRQLWPSALENDEFIVEKLRGGSYNRIIGIKTPPSTGEAHGSYVLRIPRFEFAQQAREMAIVRYVRQHTSIPTAEIIFFDSTSENPLKAPYVVHSRIPGKDLQDIYRTLDHQNKLAIAEQWGNMLLSEFAIHNDFPGVVDATADDSGAHTYGFRPFEVDPEPEEERQDVRLLSKQTVLDMFILQFERWDAADKRAYPDDFPLDHLTQLTTVAKEMDAAGLFKDVGFSLCHLDLAPRNVMVKIESDSPAQISGVLDWDSAVFGPSFLACEPPSWIWAWSNYEDENDDQDEDYREIHANDTPATPEDQELKRRFEDVVGVDMLKFFYNPRYRLARSLFSLALNGLRSNDAFPKTECLIQEWERLQSKPTESSSAVDEATVSLQQASIDEALASSEDLEL